MDHKQRKLLLACLFLCVVSIAIGVLIGYFASRHGKGPCLGLGVPNNIISEADDTVTQTIIHGISADNIRNNLRYTKITKLLKNSRP